MMSYSKEYPFDQLGSAVPDVSPPNFLCTPSILVDEVVRQAEKALTLCGHCSAIMKLFLNYEQFPAQTKNIAPY